MQRYFIDKNYDHIEFNNEQLHHITKVMRMNINDKIEAVFNSKCYLLNITSLSPFSFEIIETLTSNSELNVDITLLYCLPKGDKLDLVIQKATEIGVKNIILVQSSRCVCKFKKEDFNKKLQRFNKIASEASEQSHRLIIPTIKDIIDFKDIKNYSFDHAYIAYEKEENNTFKNSFNNVKPHQSIGIIIGSGVAVYCLTKDNPKFTNMITQKAAEYQEVAVQTNFEKIELTDSEYKFYIDPQIWVKLPENSKKSMFQLALTHIAKEKNINVENTEARNEFKGIEIYNKIKIYSSFNNELLGEYTATPAEMKKSYQKTIKGEKGALKEYIDTMNSGYKFNEHPTLP